MSNNLKERIKDFVKNNYLEKTFALLYAPNKCFLGLVDKDGNIEVKDNRNSFRFEKVFEARIFNENAELRWLKGFGEKIISDTDLADCEKLDQVYLIWGQSVGEFKNGWTKFGTARIGSFHVPIPNIADKGYAQFTTVEYLKAEEENGNVFVADERLTGIQPYLPESKGGKENA